jgi:NAD(P)-dependent dehydrogenase (short-subunit alcohol dehydrogenase family)
MTFFRSRWNDYREFRSGRLSLRSIQKLMAINVEGSFYCCTARAAKDMMRRFRSILLWLDPCPFQWFLNLKLLTVAESCRPTIVARSLAVEWAGTYSVNATRIHARKLCFLSSFLLLIDWDAHSRWVTERWAALTLRSSWKWSILKETWENLTPWVGGDPEDLKGAIIYLASDASKFTTEPIFRVDGGYSLT